MTGKRTNGTLKTVELFAGVGGFRLGLKEPYKIIWANQWEPTTGLQHAANIYKERFGSKHFYNEDISKANVKDIPYHDFLVGGFPCQDYSVARTLNQAKGIVGQKGVLWWEIYRIIQGKKRRPKYLLLENVDRLLKSPAYQRGRDFAIILASLSDLGYAVEWRVVNAADYGFPQRRRRVFIMGYHKTSGIYKRMDKKLDLSAWLFKEGVIAKSFPVKPERFLTYPEFQIKGELPDISDGFNKDVLAKFENTGVMIKRTVLTTKTTPNYKGKMTVLQDVLVPDEEVPEEFYVNDKDLPRWKFLKGRKNLVRVSKRTGRKYRYDEGSMVFPDDLDKPSRTIVTGEGGGTPSRFKHVVKAQNGRLRRLTPVELERLNMFPDNHTSGESDTKRAFLMGNALVVGVVEKLGEKLIKAIDN